jgi:glycosyltransferase involved in cell wall biosynthesis
MKKNIEVSIIIPCYNSERFIEGTINSVLNQSISDLEIIVINDGSTDKSRKVIESFIDPRIRLINIDNSGVSKARNIGLQQAKGKLVLFLDSDDLIPQNYLQAAIQVLSKDNIDFCTFKIVHINENDELIKNNSVIRGTHDNIQYEIGSFCKNISACPSAYIYKRKSLTKYNLKFNENLQSPEDRFFLLEVGRNLIGCLAENTKLMYRITDSSLSNNKNINLIKMQEVYLNQVLEKKVLLDYKIRKIFIQKMSYQLFVDYLNFNNYMKSLFFFKKYVSTFFL